MVITIIVLLILAGISITALTDKDGVINQAKKAKEATRAAQVQEEIDIWEAKEAGNMNTDSRDALIEKLKKNGTITQEEAQQLVSGGSVTIGGTRVTLGESSWNATDEKYFVWGSNDSTNGLYYRLLGINEEYASSLPENIILPRRCMDIYHEAFYANTTSSRRGVTYTTTGVEALNKIKSIKIPDTVVSIGFGAFEDCKSLGNIEIPNSVVNIGGMAFRGCTSLRSITIPNKVTSIREGTFANCTNLTNITMYDNITSIGTDAFYYCSSLSNITIPSGVTSISSGAFSYCTSLEKIVIPDGVTAINTRIFHGSSAITDITIPKSVTNIASDAFKYSYFSVSTDAVFRVVQGSYADTWLQANKYGNQTIQYIQ